MELDNLRIRNVIEEIFIKLKSKKSIYGKYIVDLNLRELGFSYEIPVKDMGIIADGIKDSHDNKDTFIVLGNIYKDKPVMVLTCTKDLAGSVIDCGNMAREVGKIIKGGGGGKKDFAQLGGSDKKSLAAAIDFAAQKAKKLLDL